MSEYDIEIAAPVLEAEVLETDEDFLEVLYAHSGIEDALEKYVKGDAEEEEVEGLLAGFSVRIAEAAWKDGTVSTELVRFAFDHLTANMNEVASRQYGYEPPRTMFQAVLNRFGAGLEPRRYVRPLDDRYWSQQFMDQYENGGMPMTPQQDHESDQQYLARYTYACMHGLLFANFTYIRG